MNAQRYGRLGLSLASALLGITLAPAAFAQASSTDAEGPPLYRIEVIVFAHNRGNSAEEDFAHIARRQSMSAPRGRDEIAEFDFGPYLPEEGAPNGPSGFDDAEDSARARLLLGRDEEPDSAGAEASGGPAAAADPGAADADIAATDPAFAEQPGGGEAEVVSDPFGGAPGNAVASFRFRLLAPQELQLGDVRRRLARGYTPLVHGGWIQEGLPSQQARPFDLAYLGASSPSGTIRLHVSRFLHLTVDLDFRPLAARAAASGVAGDDAQAAERPGAPGFGGARLPLAEVEVPNRYHLNAERRMRSGEVHYFDHPFFGVIAVVQPYEPPAPPETEGVRPAA